MSSTISGGRISHAGAGTLTLLGNNSYTGGTGAATNTLVVGGNTALGTGRLVLSSARLESSTSVTLANPLDIISRFGSTIGGSNDLAFTGSVQIEEEGGRLTVANTSGIVAFNDVVFGPGRLEKTGNGRLDLRGMNTYGGGTGIQGGDVFVHNDRSLGGGTISLSGGRLVKNVPSTVTLANPFEASGGAIHNFGAIPFTFTGPGTLVAGGTLTVINNVFEGQGAPAEVIFSGALSGEGSLTQTGGGVTTFSGAQANTYTGTTTIINGKLVLSKPADVTAIAGPLVIGDGIGGVNADVVELRADNQLDSQVSVTINESGLLKQGIFNLGTGSIEGPGAGNVVTGDPPTLTVGFNNRSTTFGGVISGPGIVVKVGTGTCTLTGNNTYEGGTTVNGGTLLINGSIVGPVTVNAGGAVPGIQRVQDFAFASGSSFVVQLNGLAVGTGYDHLDVTGSVSLNGATLNASLGFSPAPGARRHLCHHQERRH